MCAFGLPDAVGHAVGGGATLALVAVRLESVLAVLADRDARTAPFAIVARVSSAFTTRSTDLSGDSRSKRCRCSQRREEESETHRSG